jgi:hypothetical protein
MSVKSNSMHARDVTHQLHPYTDAEKHREIGPLIIEHGEGIRVFDTDGKAYIEGLAGRVDDAAAGEQGIGAQDSVHEPLPFALTSRVGATREYRCTIKDRRFIP